MTASAVAQFVGAMCPADDPVEADLRSETEALPNGQMISPREVAGVLQLLARLMGARRVLEIGTFTGYSALKLARALPPDGRLVCCDFGGPAIAIAERHWARAGVRGKIDFRAGPALDSLSQLAAEPPFDMVFVDANKKAYGDYFEHGLERLRPGGLVVFDNMLWSGEAALAEPPDAIGRYLRALNQSIAADPRVLTSLLNVGDGLLLAFKK